MRQFTVAVLLSLLLYPSSRAQALQFPGGLTETTALIAVDVTLIGLLLPEILKVRSMRFAGTVNIGERTEPDPFFPEETLMPGGRAGIFSADIRDFDLTVTFPTDGDTGTASARLTPETGAIEVFQRGLFTDGSDVFFDLSGSAPGTPVVQITVDKFDPFIGFPNGSRLGDNLNDLLLLQVLSGSVNLGIAAFPEGIGGEPAVFGTGQLSPDDVFSIGTIKPVPLPAAAPLMLLALAVSGGRRRK